MTRSQALRAELTSVRAALTELQAKERTLATALLQAEDEDRARNLRTVHEALRTLTIDTGGSFEAIASMVTSSQGIRSYVVAA